MENFYEYLDYRELLKALILERQKKDSWFSYRWISQKIGVASSGFLSLVINGKRNISSETTGNLCKIFNFNKKEADYFNALVNYNQCTNAQEKARAFEQLLILRPSSAKTITLDQQEYYNHWYYSAVREMVALYPDNESVKEIAEILVPKITAGEVRDALDLLVRIGLISKKDTGGYKRTDALLTSDGSDIDQAAIRKYHADMLDLAKNALYNIARDERDISTVTLSTNKDGVEMIKKRIAQCRKEVMAIAQESVDPDCILQVNLQLFPISKKGNKK